MAVTYQIIRITGDSWEVHTVEELWPSAHEYEVIAKVLKDGNLYWIEYPVWNDKGKTWSRQLRGYQLPKGAFRAIIEKHKTPPPETPKS